MINNIINEYGVYAAVLVLGASPLWLALVFKLLFRMKNRKVITGAIIASVIFSFYLLLVGLSLRAYYLPWDSWR